MEQKTIIFIGRSGCGKGTQADILIKELQAKDSLKEVFYLETGKKFRELVKLPNYTSELAYGVFERQDRQPDFLAVHVWSHVFIESLNGRQHLVLDGTPRSLNEAQILSGALDFYDRENRYVVYLNVSREASEKRLRLRKRGDDVKEEDIKKRLDWFDNDVMPAIEFFKNNDKYTFLDIDGEKSVEEISKELLAKVF